MSPKNNKSTSLHKQLNDSPRSPLGGRNLSEKSQSRLIQPGLILPDFSHADQQAGFYTAAEMSSALLDNIAGASEVSRGHFLKQAAMLGITVPLLASLENCGSSAETLQAYSKQILRRKKVRQELDKKIIIAEGRDIKQVVKYGMQKLGGMGMIVKPGDIVVIKPNMGWDRTPAQGANTHPHVVAALVKLAKEAGAKKVYVFDRSININTRTYRRSGIETAARRAGARVTFVNDTHFTRVPIRASLKLKNLLVYDEILKADVVINVPVLKHHNLSTLTMSLKNLMGMLGGNRGNYHKDIQNHIVDYNKAIFTSLTVLDMTRILLRHGPTGGSLEDVRPDVNKIVIGTDPVAVDATGALEFGLNPMKVEHVRKSYEEELGEGRPSMIHPIHVRV